MNSKQYYLHELPYHPNSSLQFAKIVDWPWAIFLDSCQPQGQQGRYDIMSAKPYKSLSSYAGLTRIDDYIKDPIEQENSVADPLTLLKNQIENMQFQTIEGLPFSGGALGYFSYELAEYSGGLPVHPNRLTTLPDMAIGLYDWG